MSLFAVEPEAPPLPDHALTVYAGGGANALLKYVNGGQVPPGTYVCPNCDGRGGWHDLCSPAAVGRENAECHTCSGHGVLVSWGGREPP